MAIDGVGWTPRPNPIQQDGKRQQRPKRKLPNSKTRVREEPPEKDPGSGSGGIDEVV